MFSKEELALVADGAVMASQYQPLHDLMITMCKFLREFDQCKEMVHLCKGFYFINTFDFKKAEELIKSKENDDRFKDANKLMNYIIHFAIHDKLPEEETIESLDEKAQQQNEEKLIKH